MRVFPVSPTGTYTSPNLEVDRGERPHLRPEAGPGWPRWGWVMAGPGEVAMGPTRAQVGAVRCLIGRPSARAAVRWRYGWWGWGQRKRAASGQRLRCLGIDSSLDRLRHIIPKQTRSAPASCAYQAAAFPMDVPCGCRRLNVSRRTYSAPARFLWAFIA